MSERIIQFPSGEKAPAPEKPKGELSLELLQSLNSAPNLELGEQRKAELDPVGEFKRVSQTGGDRKHVDAVLINAATDPESTAWLIQNARENLPPDLAEKLIKNLQPSE